MLQACVLIFMTLAAPGSPLQGPRLQALRPVAPETSSYQECTSPPADSQACRFRPKLFFDTALVAGSETEIRLYEESYFRIYSELGIELVQTCRSPGTLRAWGLAVSGCTGAGDARLGLGPRLTWQLNPIWTWQASGGPLWSSEEEESALTKQGWQLRTGLIYKDEMAATVLYQALPYDLGARALGTRRSGTIHSVYGGVMFHRKPGTILSIGVWGTLAALVIAFAVTYDA